MFIFNSRDLEGLKYHKNEILYMVLYDYVKTI